MKIIFMGTPEFALPSLQKLMSKHEILAVITAPDKPAGRGHQLQKSAIKIFAINNNIPILQPKNLKSEKFIEKLKILNADLFIVVAFRMLPERIWSLPKQGTLNLHASLLPKYRGAAPIQRAIMNGEKETGLTVFRLNGQIDTGDLINSLKITIGEDETGGELHDRMMELGSDLLLQSIDKLELGESQFISQVNELASEAPKIFLKDCEINWNQDVNKVYNHIRALIPYPCAWFKYDMHTYKIFKCRKVINTPHEVPGEFLIKNNSFLIACLNGYIEILEIQMEGKRRMNVIEFLNGYKSRILKS